MLAYLFVRPPNLASGGIDFTAFYCASRTLAAGANPYAEEPLRSCEHSVRHWSGPSLYVKAPLPPYALALLTPVSELPYRQAGVVWLGLLLAAASVMICAILQLTGLPLLRVGIPIAIAVLLQSLPTGALAPISLALLCAAAAMLTRKSWTSAALLLGLACIEPHVAAPVFLAVFILIREMRFRLAISALSLMAFSLAFGGISLSLFYFRTVLPAHAAFELGTITQFSLSSMLHNFGVPDHLSLAIGTVQYLVFAALGIFLAARFRRGSEALIVLIPMALAVTGGVYIHLTQVAAVLPLAFFLASRTRSPIAWAGVMLLSTPWNLLNALTPAALTVPPLIEAFPRALAHQPTPGEAAYAANFLIYAGVACTLCCLFGRFRTQQAAGTV